MRTERRVRTASLLLSFRLYISISRFVRSVRATNEREFSHRSQRRAVLIQMIDDVENIVTFANRALVDPEKKYSVTEQECLAVVWAIQKFRSYLEGYRFIIVIDYSSLH